MQIGRSFSSSITDELTGGGGGDVNKSDIFSRLRELKIINLKNVDVIYT